MLPPPHRHVPRCRASARSLPNRPTGGRLAGGLLAGGIAGLLLLLPQPAPAQQGAPTSHTRAVMELFTSQGCASCPPADLLAHRYAQDNSIVVLTLPVTCWDYLGWRDTLANEKHTKRQRIYAKLRGKRSIYTPQVVVNGVTHMIGSDEEAMRNALDELAAPSQRRLPVAIGIAQEGRRFRIAIHAGSQIRSGGAFIVLAPFYRERTVNVTGGENMGRELRYANVVPDLIPLRPLGSDSSTAAPLTFELSREEAMPGDTDGFAILVQSGDMSRPGAMLGAAAFVPAR